MNIKRLHELPLFTDGKGNVAVWQKPNLSILSWALFKVSSYAVNSPRLKDSSAKTSTALLLVWAYRESTQGINYFRRALGFLILCTVICNHFKSR